jgi:hypothetical protein
MDRRNTFRYVSKYTIDKDLLNVKMCMKVYTIFKISFAKPGKERLSERKIYVFIDNEMLNYIFNYILPLMIVLVRQKPYI